MNYRDKDKVSLVGVSEDVEKRMMDPRKPDNGTGF